MLPPDLGLTDLENECEECISNVHWSFNPWYFCYSIAKGPRLLALVGLSINKGKTMLSERVIPLHYSVAIKEVLMIQRV